MCRFCLLCLLLLPMFSSCAETKYKVILIGDEHCSFDKQEDTAIRGHNYSINIQFDRGYTLNYEYTKITIGQDEMTDSYTFDEGTNKITIDGSRVSNDIKIEAASDINTYNLDFVLGQGYKPIKTHFDVDINYNPMPFSVVITPEDGKRVNEAIKINTADGTTVEHTFTKNEDNTSYTFTIENRAEFYRDIKVNVPDALD